MASDPDVTTLRERLVASALAWQERYGVAPAVINALSELDAAGLAGMSEAEYAEDCATRTAVTKGYDFRHGGVRYQVKGSRPSGKPGSPVTLVNGPKNLDWDRLIWILYDREYQLVEAWLWDLEAYRARFTESTRLRPADLRLGCRIYPPPGAAPVRLAPVIVAPRPLATPPPSAVRAGSRPNQREMMRELYRRCGHDEERTVAAYAAAERHGDVARRSNTNAIAPEVYAGLLLEDGLKKGWLRGNPVKRRPAASAPASRASVAPDERIDRLVAGSTYRRRSLHAAGLGGGPRPGISYPARSGPVLLFSGTGRTEYGYRDGWDAGHYRYYGEWPRGGAGDMVLAAGNAAILERSPDLYLFTLVAPTRYRFEGRFACIDHTQEAVSAFGDTRLAIVFRLKRESDVVEIAI